MLFLTSPMAFVGPFSHRDGDYKLGQVFLWNNEITTLKSKVSSFYKLTLEQ